MRKATLSVAVFLSLLLCSCRAEGQKNVAFLAGREVKSTVSREWYWAQPMPVAGVPNCYRVSDEFIRGDEPSPNGLKRLGAMGVRTSVCVRSWGIHSTESRAKDAGMQYRQIYMVAWAPTEEDIVEFLKIMADPANRPVFIHCYTGGDRAGLLTAVYRVAFCGWPKSEACDEMLLGNYSFHEILVDYLVPFFEQLDIDRLKRQAGVTEASITDADRKLSWERVKNSRYHPAEAASQGALVNPAPSPYNGGHEADSSSDTDSAAAGWGDVPGILLPSGTVQRQRRPKRRRPDRLGKDLGAAAGPARPAQPAPSQR